MRLGDALIPPWDRMWPFRAGRLLNSFRQMEHVSLFLASNCSPNTPLVWPLLDSGDPDWALPSGKCIWGHIALGDGGC